MLLILRQGKHQAEGDSNVGLMLGASGCSVDGELAWVGTRLVASKRQSVDLMCNAGLLRIRLMQHGASLIRCRL